MLQSHSMQGRKDQKHGSETRDTVWVELDELALTRELKRFVEESELSIPKIASGMGLSQSPSLKQMHWLAIKDERLNG